MLADASTRLFRQSKEQGTNSRDSTMDLFGWPSETTYIQVVRAYRCFQGAGWRDTGRMCDAPLRAQRQQRRGCPDKGICPGEMGKRPYLQRTRRLLLPDEMRR